MRVIPQQLVKEIVKEGITPAHAGNTNYLAYFSNEEWDHPRACG